MKAALLHLEDDPEDSEDEELGCRIESPASAPKHQNAPVLRSLLSNSNRAC